MRIRALGAVAAALTLVGCYTSDKLLLDPGQAATPLALGRQQTAGGGDRPQTVDIALDPDRWYRVRSDGKDERMLFTPMAGAADGGQRYAFAFGDHDAFLYGVAERRDGKVYLDVPFCDLGPARDAAIAHGVAIPTKGAMSPVCTFKDAARLTAALTDYANRPGDKAEVVSLPAKTD